MKKHQNNRIPVLLLLTAFSLSSCFNIVEEITLRKDGSGSYRFSLDGKEIANMAEGFRENMAGATDAETPETPPDTVVVKDKFAGLKKMDGISNVVEINDKATMSMGVTFDFANLKAFQQVMDSLGNNKAFGAFGVGRNLTIDGKNLTRAKGNSIRDILAGIMKQKTDDKNGAGLESSAGFMKMIFGSMTFKQIYHFPDRKIKKCNQKGAEISKDKHTLTILEKPFKDDQPDKKSAPSELLIRLK